MIYLIGSLRNPKVPILAEYLRTFKLDIFDDWYAAGPEADDKWKEYEVQREHTYMEALHGEAAKHVFSFDQHWLDYCNAGILLLPAGKSAHMEAGYLSRDKPVYVLFNEEPERWDVMYKFLIPVIGHESLAKLLVERGL